MQQSLQFRAAAVNIPHPAKVSYGGEDAWFVSTCALGVADGVGGWAADGVNPADYSKLLMENARRFLHEMEEDLEILLDPDALMASGEWGNPSLIMRTDPATVSRDEIAQSKTAVAAIDTAHRLTRLPGSSTACVLRLDTERKVLDAANVGDSGFLIIRDGSVVFKSPPLQHFWDCPYQLAAAPEFTTETDSVDDAQIFDVPVLPGDVVILGTDGLFDNVFTEDIQALAPKSADEVELAAENLANLASKNAGDEDWESPYARGAVEAGLDIPLWEKIKGVSIKEGKLEMAKLKGGKVDDITVVVAIVC